LATSRKDKKILIEKIKKSPFWNKEVEKELTSIRDRAKSIGNKIPHISKYLRGIWDPILKKLDTNSLLERIISLFDESTRKNHEKYWKFIQFFYKNRENPFYPAEVLEELDPLSLGDPRGDFYTNLFTEGYELNKYNLLRQVDKKVNKGYRRLPVCLKRELIPLIEFLASEFNLNLSKDIAKVKSTQSQVSTPIKQKKDEIDKIFESDIEDYLKTNLEILEKGLVLVGQQYRIPRGSIDLLCKDKDGIYLIIEIKKSRSSDKVVGQIQRYMGWASENLADNGLVRGMIIVKEYDERLEYAVKISRFPIEIKKFGTLPPLMKNIVYCNECGKPNQKNAKFCKHCGQEFWM